MKRIAGILAAVLLWGVSGASAAETMREGLWEIRSQTEMPGMPMKLPASTIRHCYTKEDVKDQKRMVNTDKNCKMTEYKVTGNKATWAMVCTGEQSGTFSGVTIFSKDAYTSTMKMKSQGYSMTMRVQAKRIGECPKK